MRAGIAPRVGSTGVSGRGGKVPRVLKNELLFSNVASLHSVTEYSQ